MAADPTAELKQLERNYEVNTRTCPFQLYDLVGRPTDERIQQIRALKGPPRQELRRTLDERTKLSVPMGPYPYHQTGVGWCQLHFQADSVALKYMIFGHYYGLSVRAESQQQNKKVSVWGRSEEYDAESRSMKLQGPNEGWQKAITEDKARAIICVSEQNWALYNKEMLQIKRKEEAKLVGKRPPRKSPTSKVDHASRALMSLSRGKTATTRSDRPRKVVGGTKKKVVAQKLKFPPAAKAQKFVDTPATKKRKLTLKIKSGTPAQRKELSRKLKKRKLILKQQREHTLLESVMSSQKSWSASLKSNPGLTLARMLKVYMDAGDSVSLHMCAVRLINNVTDGDKREVAQLWREQVSQKIRQVQTSNNERLNNLKDAVADLEDKTSFEISRTVRVTSTPGALDGPKNDAVVINLEDSVDSDVEVVQVSKGPTPTVKAKGPKGPPPPTVKAQGPKAPPPGNRQR